MPRSEKVLIWLFAIFIMAEYTLLWALSMMNLALSIKRIMYFAAVMLVIIVTMGWVASLLLPDEREKKLLKLYWTSIIGTAVLVMMFGMLGTVAAFLIFMNPVIFVYFSITKDRVKKDMKEKWSEPVKERKRDGIYCYCPKCLFQVKIEEGGDFCPKCGGKMKMPEE